jgi:preprotein translocase subunit YajC
MVELIAQAATTTQPPGPGFGSMLMPLLLMGAIFYFLIIRPNTREKHRRSEMLGAIKKNDRVVTIGGIIGTVASVREDEVTLKVDESNNTKITFSRGSIQRIIAPSGASSEESTSERK